MKHATMASPVNCPFCNREIRKVAVAFPGPYFSCRRDECVAKAQHKADALLSKSKHPQGSLINYSVDEEGAVSYTGPLLTLRKGN